MRSPRYPNGKFVSSSVLRFGDLVTGRPDANITTTEAMILLCMRNVEGTMVRPATCAGCAEQMLLKRIDVCGLAVLGMLRDIGFDGDDAQWLMDDAEMKKLGGRVPLNKMKYCWLEDDK